MINGFTVGRVSQIKLMQEDSTYIAVTLEINKETRITEGAIAALGDNGLLGGKAVFIKCNPKSTPLESGATLVAGVENGLIASLQTQIMPVMGTVDSALVAVKNMLSEFNGIGKRIDLLMANISSLSTQANGLIADNRQSLKRTISSFDSLTKSLNKTLSPMISTYTDLGNKVKALEIQQTLDQLNKTMAELQKTAQGINNPDGSIGQLMKTDSLHKAMVVMLKDVDNLLIDFQANPKRYVHFSLIDKGAKTDAKAAKKDAKKQAKKTGQ